MLYFAYGSNMLRERVQQRVGRVAAPERAVIRGHRFFFNKRGRDGSGKGNLMLGADSVAYGALYELTDSQSAQLSRFEIGYGRTLVSVEVAGQRIDAFTYVAEPAFVCDWLRPFCWYRSLVLAAAASLEFPQEYVTGLARFPYDEDPDVDRRRRHQALLA